MEQDGLFYPEFSEVPFTGKVMGKTQGSFRNGKTYGPWVLYDYNGQLLSKGTLKDGKRDGLWVEYLKDGAVSEHSTGTFKDGVKVK